MTGPWLKFFPSDWRADPALRSCSIAARGLWMEMLCIMHEAEPRGSLLINGRAVSDKQLANLAGIGLAEIDELLAELHDAGVFSTEDDGTIYSRRMRKDDVKAAKDKANGGRGGNPSLKPGVNPEDKAQKPEARDQNTSSLRSEAAAPPVSNVIEYPIDPVERLWAEGVALLVEAGVSERSARSNIGRWLRDSRDDAGRLLDAIRRAREFGTKDPIPLIARMLNPVTRNGLPKPTVHDAAALLDDWAANGGQGTGDVPRPAPLRLLSQG